MKTRPMVRLAVGAWLIVSLHFTFEALLDKKNRRRRVTLVDSAPGRSRQIATLLYGYCGPGDHAGELKFVVEAEGVRDRGENADAVVQDRHPPVRAGPLPVRRQTPHGQAP